VWWVGVGWWVVESEFSDRLWLSLSLALAKLNNSGHWEVPVSIRWNRIIKVSSKQDIIYFTVKVVWNGKDISASAINYQIHAKYNLNMMIF
jgi:hypothetical protein